MTTPDSTPAQSIQTERFWNLNDKGVPPEEEKNLPIDAILKIEGNTYPINDLSARRIRHLIQTDLTQVPMTEKAWRAYHILQKNHPELFNNTLTPLSPQIKLLINNKEYFLSKNRLPSLSETFRVLLSSTSNFSEAKENKIVLEVPEDLENMFTEYLMTGKTNISPQGAYRLYYLARKYDFEDLQFAALQEIKKNLDEESALVLLEDALDMDLPDLLTIGLDFAWKHTLVITDKNEDKGELRFFLQALQILKEKNVEYRGFCKTQ